MAIASTEMQKARKHAGHAPANPRKRNPCNGKPTQRQTPRNEKPTQRQTHATKTPHLGEWHLGIGGKLCLAIWAVGEASGHVERKDFLRHKDQACHNRQKRASSPL